MTKEEIRTLFGQHEVPITQSDVWTVQNALVIKHSALERLSVKIGIRWDMPVVLRNEADEAVMIISAKRDNGAFEWSTGEAKVNSNYKVSGKQASYVYAMAEKRGKDRVIIKLAGLHGVYSEEEADDFRNGGDTKAERPDLPIPTARQENDNRPVDKEAPSETTVVDGVIVDADGVVQPSTPEDVVAAMKADLDAFPDKDALTAYMTSAEVQKALGLLKAAPREEVREHAKAILRDKFDWPKAKKRAGG